jgi:hypothetical protein
MGRLIGRAEPAHNAFVPPELADPLAGDVRWRPLAGFGAIIP